jgi:hypothetical protein
MKKSRLMFRLKKKKLEWFLNFWAMKGWFETIEGFFFNGRGVFYAFLKEKKKKKSSFSMRRPVNMPTTSCVSCFFFFSYDERHMILPFKTRKKWSNTMASPPILRRPCNGPHLSSLKKMVEPVPSKDSFYFN